MSEFVSATVVARIAIYFVTRIATSVARTGFITGIAIADFITRRTTSIIATTSKLETFEKFSE
jgi:hypothetical protein